jgi:hypothetical protein
MGLASNTFLTITVSAIGTFLTIDAVSIIKIYLIIGTVSIFDTVATNGLGWFVNIAFVIIINAPINTVLNINIV